MQESLLLLICIAVSFSLAHSRNIMLEKLENRTIVTNNTPRGPNPTGFWLLYSATNCGSGSFYEHYIYSGDCIPETISLSNIYGVGYDTLGQSFMFTYQTNGEYYNFETFQDTQCVYSNGNYNFNGEEDDCYNIVVRFPTIGLSYSSFYLD